MVSAESFFVFGGGRWRALDAASGRLEGWGRARFLVAGEAGLLARRARPVLAALRALASGAPSAASAGPNLPYRSLARAESTERGRGGCEHCCCCQHRRNEKKASVAIQCSEDIISTGPSRLTNVPRHSKRKRDSTSSDDLSARDVTTQRRPEAKRRCRPSTSSDSTTKPKGRSHSEASNNGTKASLKRKRRSSSERSLVLASSITSPKGLKLRKPGPRNGKRSARERSPVLKSKISSEIRRENKMSKFLRPTSKRIRKESSDERVPKRTTRQNVSLVISSDDSDFESDNRHKWSSTKLPIDVGLQITPATDKVTRKKGPRRAPEESASDKQINNKMTLKPVAKSSPHPIVESLDKNKISSSIKHKVAPKRAVEKAKTEINGERSSADASTSSHLLVSARRAHERAEGKEFATERANKLQETPKELVIEERDVEILRLYLQKHYPDEELLRFDTDDEYKKMHFYQINPLVNVERCPQIDRMIRGQSHGSQLSLVDFANKLGLRSISDDSKPRRYRTRRRDKQTVDNAMDSSLDKENLDRPTRSNNVKAEKVLKESLNKDRARENKKEMGNIVEISESSGNESERRRNNLEKPLVMKPKRKPTTSTKRSASKEYSSLEDHAIVSWVSVGGRACCVNGNRLWRELQTQYCRITGHSRTWHSLRNRYLRYILPRLASLALPPPQQSRLRAAAATGELKARRKEPRRNSMFAPPPRGAASRRPPLALSPPAGGRDLRAGMSPREPSPRRAHVTRRSRTHSREERGSNSPRKAISMAAGRSPQIKSPDGTTRKRSKSTSVSSERRTNSASNRKSRQKSPSVSSESESDSDSSESSEAEHRSVRNRGRVDSSLDLSSDSDPPPARTIRRSNRHRSPSESNTRKSQPRPESSNEDSHKSNRRKSRGSLDLSSDSDPRPVRAIRRSNRHRSPSESNTRKSQPRPESIESDSHKSNRRKSRRISPSESNRRKSNRHRSPSKDTRKLPAQAILESVDKSNRRKSNRHKSPESGKRAPEDSNEEQPSRVLRNKSPVKPRMRKLFNPRAFL